MKHLSVLAACLLLAACGRTATEPEPSRVRLEAWGDDVLYAPAAGAGAVTLQVLARHATTGAVEKDVAIQWSSVSGGGTLAQASTTTNEYGLAEARFTPAGSGTFRIRASSSRITGAAPELEVRVVPVPVISAIAPAAAVAGQNVTISGTGFSATADHNIVLFEGIRGRVLAATATQLQVEVPACLPGRSARVTAGFGSFASTEFVLAVSGGTGAAVDLVRGQAVTLSGDALACVRMPDTPGASYLAVAQHVATQQTPPLPLSLRAVTGQGIVAAPTIEATAPAFAQQWEAALRARERRLLPDPEAAGVAQEAAAPELGERRTFNVLNQDNKFDKATAEVRLITARGVFYVDVEAATSLTEADLVRFGQLFDDPIYPTDVEVFGEPSDIDNNDRILILLTPKVNALTPRGAGSFIAGYFYGCDLVSASRCSGTNRAEIFYSLVPDPAAKWGDARSAAAVMNSVPTVLAHEFQHMINFARRNQTMESLWLSEGLAHTAEEIVAERLAARGETQTAARFMAGNTTNTQRFLASPSVVDQLTEEPPGTLESRGAAWLFLKYLRGHFGGHDLLRRLTASSRTSTANVAAETGTPWDRLRADFGIAIAADGAPELAGATLDARHRFVGYSPRAALGGSSYALRPVARAWSDFNASLNLTSGGYAYSLLRAPVAAVPPLTFVLSDMWGRATGPAASVTVLRMQ